MAFAYTLYAQTAPDVTLAVTVGSERMAAVTTGSLPADLHGAEGVARALGAGALTSAEPVVLPAAHLGELAAAVLWAAREYRSGDAVELVRVPVTDILGIEASARGIFLSPTSGPARPVAADNGNSDDSDGPAPDLLLCEAADYSAAVSLLSEAAQGAAALGWL
jgi:hypothetical protein